MTKPIRSDFPIFERYPDLAYLDNAATTQMPKFVIDAITEFNSFGKANIHRGVYDLSNEATSSYESVRNEAADFLHASGADCIAFTKGVTESINVVARSFVQPRLQKGDNVVTTVMEHHANFLPWQQICQESNAEFRVAPVAHTGDLDIDELAGHLDSKTKMLAVTHVSNTLGTINPVKEIIELAHQKGIPVLVDAAQSAAYYDLDVGQLGCDFLTFSGHKIFGPFGVGVLYASEKHRDDLMPYNYGGGMIRQVAIDNSSFVKYPYHLDAGTPNITGVIGLGKAIEYVGQLQQKEVRRQLNDLTSYALQKLQQIHQVTIVGSPQERSGIISFTVGEIHPHDVASFLNKDGLALRAGMHCTQPLLDYLGVPVTVRASFSIYNSKEEIDRLHDSLVELIKFWS